MTSPSPKWSRSRRTAAAASIAVAIAAPAEGLRQYLSAPLSPTPFDKAPRRRIPLRKLMFGANWRGSGFFKRPSTGSDSIVHYSDWDTVQFCDLGPRNAVVAHIDDCSISGLGFFGCPGAVIRVVSKIIVLALYRQIVSVSRVLRPSIKGFKFKPLVADRYPFTAIAFIGEVTASGEHVAPTVVEPSPLHSVGSRPCSDGGPRPLAATRDAFPMSKVASDNLPQRSARTTAKPERSAALGVARFFENQPFAECFSGKFYQARV